MEDYKIKKNHNNEHYNLFPAHTHIITELQTGKVLTSCNKT